jgi:hypothetical protein
MPLLGASLAFVIGLTLGLLGGGGSILMVPVLVYVLGYAAKPAIAMSLPIVGLASLVGSVSHWRQGNVAYRAAIPFGLATMAGSFAGARFAQRLSGVTQLGILGIVMLAAALSMLRGGVRERAGVIAPLPLLLLVGVGVGALTGVVGIGGGFLIVPALVLLAHMPMKQAVGTSLVVIAMNATAGFAGYLGSVAIDWRFLLLFATVAIAGILVGSRLVRHVPASVLRRIFAGFLLVMAVFVLWQNRAAFGLA